MKPRGVLILSGYNTRGIIAFCRFCTQNNISFFIVASDPDDLILLSDYKKNVIEIRDSFRLSLDNFFNYKRNCENGIAELLILPSTEFLNRFLLINRETLQSNGFIIPLCSLQLYEQLSDKINFTELCKANGITVPQEYDTLETVRFPFVAKPKKYFLNQLAISEKPIIVSDNISYEKLKKANATDFYFQEFIGGRSFYLLFYFSNDGSYSVFSQENLIQQHNGLSIIAAKSSNIHQDSISSEYATILLKAGYTGLIMIEVKFFNNKFYMIEANPRLWGPSQLIPDAGMDLFDRFALENGLIVSYSKKEYLVDKKYFWPGGITEDQEKDCSSAFHNYNRQTFFDDYSQWSKADIYLRTDTATIAIKETNKK